MSMEATQTKATPRVNMRSVALPSEHGGWGFLLEPVLLGMLVAPTWAGLALSSSMLAIFLVHQPFKIALKDHLKGRRVARTIMAERFALGYGLLGLVSFGVAWQLAEYPFAEPFLIALPLMGVQLYHDARNHSRDLLSEMSGAVALATIAPALARLAGWSFGAALVLGVLLVGRNIPSILYVRARLRLERQTTINPTLPWLAHGVTLATVLGLCAINASPWLVLGAMMMLTARAGLGLSSYRRPARAVQIGVREVLFGLATVTLIALGYGFNL
jgi:hypothetical protein